MSCIHSGTTAKKGTTDEEGEAGTQVQTIAEASEGGKLKKAVHLAVPSLAGDEGALQRAKRRSILRSL
jgi:hypothetical protein